MAVLLLKTYDFTGDAGDLCTLFRGEPHLFCLDSSRRDADNGRYSFLGFDPFEVFQAKGGRALDLLKEKYSAYRTERGTAATPFAHGIVGYLGYDYGLHQEKIPLRAEDDLNLPDAVFGFYDCVLTIDHFQKKLYVTSSGLPEKNKALREKRAAARLEYVERKFKGLILSPAPEPAGVDCLGNFEISPGGFSSNFTKERYLSAVRKALEHIAAGDIYQLNLSQRFTCAAEGRQTSSPGLVEPDGVNSTSGNTDPLEIYRVLRRLSPVSFGGYFNAGAFQLISNSPEMFLRRRGSLVQTRPMKGTRPRAGDPREDRRLKNEIEQSVKDKAELLMITDLERNDLGKVCDYGSVRVREMRTIEEYNYVFQAVSLVEGALRPGKDCFDIFESCFPGGSITGCPKIRAMEIIEALEPTRRGPYTGCLGYIDFAGNMDFNILIRTLLHCGQKIHFQVGGGIVADSTPEGEYEETLVKARAMYACLKQMRNYAQTDHLARR